MPRCLVIGVALAAATGCRTESCLSGGADCQVVSPCLRVQYQCAGGMVRVRHVSDGALPLSGPDLTGTRADVVLENDRIAAVVDALGEPRVLAPTGGTLIDLGPRGGADQLNQIYTVAGILPADAFHYTSLEIIDQSPSLVAVMLRGTLDGRPAVKVATRYELRPCEPGVRARSELYNGSADIQTFFLADVSYWGNREPLPFAPASGQGFLQPKLDLVEIDKAWGRFPFVAARAVAAPAVAYGFVSCDPDHAELEGINDPFVSGLGLPRTVTRPGESLAFERMLLTAPGPDIDSVARLAHEVRQQAFGEPPTATLRGRVIAAGLPRGGSETRAAVLISELLTGGALAPWTEALPAADGTFAATVPAGRAMHVDVRSFGRTQASREVPAAADLNLGDIEVPAPATLHASVRDGAGPTDAVLVLTPADAATRDAVTGTQEGRFDPCAPWLGPPHGGSPACNRVLARGDATLEAPAGHYFVYASVGPLATLARAEVTLGPGESRTVALAVSRLPSLAPGMLSADLHVHGRASFDSSLPDGDRVLSFAATGVDVIAATDHDAVVDYLDAVAQLGLAGRVHVMAGIETTGLIPFFHRPGDDIPRVIGHFNFWPVYLDPTAPRGGAPWDELAEPGALFDRMAPVMAPGGLMMMNHPWDEPMTGRDLGYLRAVGYDPRRPIPPHDDGTRAGMLARRPAGGRSNMEFQVLEVLNGRSVMKFEQYRALWWSLLSQGFVYAGAANSDSHSLSDVQLGWPRNLVATNQRLDSFRDDAFDADVAAGHMVAGYGIVIDARLDGQRFGLAPLAPRPGATLDLEVRAAPWIPVAELRIVVNGQVVRTLAATSPPDPFGSDGLVRYRGSLPLADLVPAGRDAWLLVEAGLELPAAADIDDDGIVDTTDNNGDGTIDRRDVEPGEDKGPLRDPPDPKVEANDARFHLTVVAPGTWPLAFTNPWLIDGNGDGRWEAPGL